MILFLLLLLPLILLGYEVWRKNQKDFFPVLIGFLGSAVYCALRAFFVFSHRVIPYSFGANLFFTFFHQEFLPVVIVYGLFFAFSKDKFEYKIDSFWSLMFSFYSVFLPYIVISSNDSNFYSGFSILVKPLLIASMIFETGILLKFFEKNFINKNILMIVVDSVVLLVYMIFAAIIETLYLMDEVIVLRIILEVLYIVLPVVYVTCRNLIKKNK